MKRNTRIAADLMFAPLVIAMRLPLMAAEAQKAGPPTETIRATTEKLSAFAEGAVAAQMAYVNAMMSFWPEVMTGKNPSLLSGAAARQAMQAAFAPASRRVRSNLRRLSGT